MLNALQIQIKIQIKFITWTRSHRNVNLRRKSKSKSMDLIALEVSNNNYEYLWHEFLGKALKWLKLMVTVINFTCGIQFLVSYSHSFEFCLQWQSEDSYRMDPSIHDHSLLCLTGVTALGKCQF